MQATKRFFQETWYPVTLGLFLFPVICLLLGTFGFLVGIPITKWHAPIGFILSIVCATYLCKFWYTKVVIAGLISVILGILLVVSSLTFSWTCDDFVYFKPAAIAMHEGWNPYWFPNQFSHDIRDGNIPLIQIHSWWYQWVEHYPKATWIVGSQIYAATGNIDQVHVMNILLVFVTAPICFVALRTIFGLSIFKSLLFSLVLAGNPISLALLYTSQLDGILVSYLTVLFLSLAAYFIDRNSRWLPFIIGSIILATNVKFTGVVYVGLFLLVVLGGQLVMDWWHKRRVDRKILFAIGIATVLSLIVGINPYFQNLYKHHHPFYPLMVTKKTDTKVDFASGFLKGGLKEATPLQRFFFSYMTSPNQLNVHSDIPYFTTSPNRLLANINVNPWGLNAFGVQFAIPLAFSLFMLPMIRNGNVWILLIAIWATVLIQPHNWYGRYVPQLWIIPVIVLCALSAQSKDYPSIKRRFDWIIYFMIFLFLTASWGGARQANKCQKDIRSRTITLFYLSECFPGRLYFSTTSTRDPWRGFSCSRCFYEAFIRDMSPVALLGEEQCHSLSGEIGGIGPYAHYRVSYIPSDESEALNSILSRHASETLLVSLKDDAKMPQSFSDDTKQFFRDAGGNIDQLKEGGAYVAVLQGGKIVAEEIDDETCELKFRDPQTGQSFRLTSGNNSSIRINKKEHSPNRRGLNVVVLDENPYPIGYSFDTFADPNPPGVPHLVLRNHQVITEMLKLRLRQLQNVWMPPVSNALRTPG